MSSSLYELGFKKKKKAEKRLDVPVFPLKKEAQRGEAVQKKDNNNNYGKFKEGI